jgi:hypothetical protein
VDSSRNQGKANLSDFVRPKSFDFDKHNIPFDWHFLFACGKYRKLKLFKVLFARFPLPLSAFPILPPNGV